MIGAIAGDMIGAPYEAQPIKTRSFPLFQAKSRFTDDSVMTVAVAQVLLDGGDMADTLRRFGREWSHAGYGGMFIEWLMNEELGPYGSFGNGAAMRVSPVGWAAQSKDQVLEMAERSAAVSHDHPEGIKGAQALALAVFRARHNTDPTHIRDEVEQGFGYDLSRSVDTIRPNYGFDPTCQGSVPEALICALDGVDWEDAVRKAVSLGGDSDTLACMAGAVAEARWGGVPEEVRREVLERLPEGLSAVVHRFYRTYAPHLYAT